MFSRPHRTSRRDLLVRLFASVASIVVIVALLISFIDPDVLTQQLRDASLLLIVFGGGVHVISWGVRVFRYQRILDILDYDIEYRQLAGIVMSTQVGNIFFPLRTGDALRAYLLNNSCDVPFSSGFSSAALERLFDFLTVGVIAGLTMLLLLGTALINVRTLLSHEMNTAVVLALIFGGVLILSLVFVVMVSVIFGSTSTDGIFRSILDRIVEIPRIGIHIEAFVADLRGFMLTPRDVIPVGASSVIIWALDSLTAVLIFTGFRIRLTPMLIAASVLAVSVGALAKIVPISPGGIGPYEAAFALIVIASTSLEWETALSVSIIDHAVKNLTAIIMGITLILLYNISLLQTIAASEGIESDATSEDS